MRLKFYLQNLTKNAVLIATVIVATTSIGFGQISIPDNATQTTNFNGWNGTMPSGWSATSTYRSTTQSTTGGTYAIAGSGFGFQPSSSATSVVVTATYQNNTGADITSLQISYQAFNIVNRVSRLPAWTVTSTLGSVSNLNWAYNINSSATTPDSLGVVLTGLTIANGATFTLTFSSDRGSGSGSSPLIGMNNVSVTNLTTTSPLFIRLNEFKVVNRGNTNDLTWATATENTGDVFEMERSSDGRIFNKISTINAKGVAPSVYGCTDKDPISGFNYYRLKLIDKDGSVNYSNTVSANVVDDKAFAITAYPNPMIDKLNVAVNGNVSAATEITLLDQMGRINYQQTVVKPGTIVINTSQLVSGTYFIRYSNSKEQKVIKVTK